MKRLATILIFLLIVFAGYSQADSTTRKDTCICISPKEMINAIRVDDSLQLSTAIIRQQDSIISSQKSIIIKSDSVIKKQDDLHVNDLNRIDNLLFQNRELTGISSLSLTLVSDMKSQIGKERKKTLFIGGISIAIITSLSYLLVTK